ncbi:ATP12-domain-containing protein [Dacryopinax primogenitus]|uniref:ATP12-domain-containing protein n=1 Tax=Dacryopinax primogenitus (strain DJM 731) TaxID=1858805 RepID=M5GEK0_DACPD|nr:ATP12-domain-containing protein [Dacryopinax primogenitus]EJU05482.1 ATP12-domain-containing protein [Dacryopinax primogenitus]
MHILFIKRAFTTTRLAANAPVTQTNRAEATMKRFWKSVDVSPSKQDPETLAITLDKRPLKTPLGKPLAVPNTKPLLAALIAHEWDSQENVIKPHALPVTSLASRALDGMHIENVHAQVRDALLKYFDTDTICFHEHHHPSLVRLQDAHWKPIIDWAQEKFGVEIRIFTDLMGNVQPPETRKALGDWIAKYDAWQLAALERAVYATKSFLIALALVEGRITAEEAAQAAHVEVNSQIERWGEVEDSHDVDYHDIRRQLGSVACLSSKA